MALPRCIRQLGLLSEIEKDEWLKPYMFRRLGSPRSGCQHGSSDGLLPGWKMDEFSLCPPVEGGERALVSSYEDTNPIRGVSFRWKRLYSFLPVAPSAVIG